MLLNHMKPPPPWLDMETVEREFARLITGRNLLVRFPKRLEGVFNDERAAKRQRQLVNMGVLALLVFDMFLVGDYLVMPGQMVRALVVRLGIVTPLVLVALWFHWRRRLPAIVPDLTAILYSVLVCAATLYLHHFSSASIAMRANVGVVLLLVVMNTLLRPDLWSAVLGTGICCSIFFWFLTSTHLFTRSEQWTVGGQVFWCAVLTLLANHVILREQRISWLLQMRGRMQRQSLTDANRELLNLSMYDHLTGIPNRAAYDKRLVELWERAVSLQEPLAVVMVDVDYFKQVNDSFGHLFGDRVLQRIAKLLEQSMRAELDFVARYGGEEFIVLLPGSNLEQGLHVAERIRMLVQVAGSPAVVRGETPLPEDVKWSTVSCGVASTHPQAGHDARDLIDAADAALYVAKESGRNRVCCSEAVPAEQLSQARMESAEA